MLTTYINGGGSKLYRRTNVYITMCMPNKFRNSWWLNLQDTIRNFTGWSRYHFSHFNRKRNVPSISGLLWGLVLQQLSSTWSTELLIMECLDKRIVLFRYLHCSFFVFSSSLYFFTNALAQRSWLERVSSLAGCGEQLSVLLTMGCMDMANVGYKWSSHSG